MLRTLVRDKKTNVLSNSCTVGGGVGRLVEADAEKPGPVVQELKAHYECADAPGGIGHRRRDGYGDHARHRNALSTLAPRVRAASWLATAKPKSHTRRIRMRFQLLRQ